MRLLVEIKIIFHEGQVGIKRGQRSVACPNLALKLRRGEDTTHCAWKYTKGVTDTKYTEEDSF